MEDPSTSNLLPAALRSQKDVLFGNMPEIYQFHSRHARTQTHTGLISSHTANPSLSVQGFPPGSAALPGDAGEGGILLPAAGEETAARERQVTLKLGTSNWVIFSGYEQKEKFQVYERYCQNKPRSELLWRQCSDSAFFQVPANL